MSRTGLFEWAGASARVTVISAPPGSGKSVLLRSWIRAAHLRFSLAEARELFAATGVELPQAALGMFVRADGGVGGGAAARGAVAGWASGPGAVRG